MHWIVPLCCVVLAAVLVLIGLASMPRPPYDPPDEWRFPDDH